MTTKSAPWTRDLGLLAMRIMVGWVMFFHGAQKLFGWFDGGGLAATGEFMGKIGMPLPAVSAFMAAGTEFLGGAALVLGLGTRFVVVPLVFTMLVASFVVHGKAFSGQAGGMEYPLTLAVVMFGLGLTGAGRLSLDALLRRPSTAKAAAAMASA